MGVKILHTSDWHLGRSLHGRKRYEEFDAFLDWLGQLLEQEQIDVLLVAGDIFDTKTPSNQAQELYYQFLCRAAESPCRHVVITAGNHDSPSFLNAPRELLRYLQVYIVGSMEKKLEEEVLLLNDSQGETELIVCAVPYLRDRDIRSVEPGETPEDKERKLIDGIRSHYTLVAQQAQEVLKELEKPVPVIAMGHLFAAGGSKVKGDGVRDLYVGTLVHVGADIFSEEFDYVALGHLHTAQLVAGHENIRYSGTPLPMSFSEATRDKQVITINFNENRMEINPILVPVFQALQSVRGDWEQIEQQMVLLKAEARSVWLEIIYEGAEIISDLRERLDDLVADTELEIMRVKNNRLDELEKGLPGDGEILSELDVIEVFELCLQAYEVEPEQREDLLKLYNEVVCLLNTEDLRVE